MDNETAGAEILSRPVKKYSCADVYADLADQIAVRAKARRVGSGAYLSRLLEEAFAREDRGTIHEVEPQASPQALVRFRDGLAAGFVAPQPPHLMPEEPHLTPAAPPPPRFDTEALRALTEIAREIATLRQAGAGEDLLAPLLTTYRAGLQALRRKE